MDFEALLLVHHQKRKYFILRSAIYHQNKSASLILSLYIVIHLNLDLKRTLNHPF